MLEAALLGTGGMMPLPDRYLTALMCRHNGGVILIDCGEGTQVTAKLLGWGYKSIDAICFTHYHADHISGLPGMLLAISNSMRTEPLHLIGPIELKRVVENLRVIVPELAFEIIFHEIMKMGEMIQINEIEISVIEMNHRCPCLGYKLHVPRKGKFDPERAQTLGLPVKHWSELQKKGTTQYNGISYTDDMVMGPERKGITVCYMTDSRPVKGIADFIKGSDLFVCEGIYGENDKINKAVEYRHMIFREAAELAKSGEASELWLTHFSPSMTNPMMFRNAASDIFPNTIVGYDRLQKTIYFQD